MIVKPINVFVYGTLLFPEVTNRLGIVSIDDGSEVPLIREAATLNGYRRFTVRLRDVGNFPAIVPAEDSVEGEVLRNVSVESLHRLDNFEGIADGYYSREEVTVQAAGEATTALAYICGSPLRPHLSGSWDANKFRTHELQWYLQNVVQ
jgi:gamma-glutamylcyclotransferase (GGCT)/AIG2-like uncharacterized protein YtfP